VGGGENSQRPKKTALDGLINTNAKSSYCSFVFAKYYTV
jgi:hypothetical protein